jgi:hypothetical protein
VKAILIDVKTIPSPENTNKTSKNKKKNKEEYE